MSKGRRLIVFGAVSSAWRCPRRRSPTSSGPRTGPIRRPTPPSPARRRQGARAALARVGRHRQGPGKVRVVCQGNGGWKSLSLLSESIDQGAQARLPAPPEPAQAAPEPVGRLRLLWQNVLLARRCAYNEIQPAVNASGNNDRVVVMPGVYTEPTSRAQPLNDPRCAGMTQEDSGGAKTPSYKYQVTCPNDQNLIHIQGRAVPTRRRPARRSRTARASPTSARACAATSSSRAPAWCRPT